MVTKTKVFGLHVKAVEPVTAVCSPVIKPFKVSTGLAEEFKLHLLELTYTENEVTGSDFVTEGLTDLCNAEGYLSSCCSLDVSEVYENTLCGFGTKVDFVLAVLSYTLEGLEHKVELTDISEVVCAAIGARNVLFVDISSHLFV